MIALVDCNSFYASCERFFNPSLENNPVVILSGPEGCIVCASPEAKALGARVGEPWFLAKKKLGLENAAAISANFELYGDMSRRVMQCLARSGFEMEIYSIDESFISLPDSLDEDGRLAWALTAKKSCAECGIPVSIGLGPTKTLAKLASSWAKPHAGGCGVFDIQALLKNDPSGFDAKLASCPCSDIWGVGPRSAMKLESQGLCTALDIAQADLGLLKKIGTIALARSGSELRGRIEYPIATESGFAKSLSRTRTFEKAAPTHKELSAAIAGFAQTACYELRRTGSLAAKAEIFIGTHPMDKRGPARFASCELELGCPTSDSILIGSQASLALRKIFKPGYAYRRAGITFGALSPDPEFGAVEDQSAEPSRFIIADADFDIEPVALNAFSKNKNAPDPSKSKRANLLATLDGLRSKFGSASIESAASLGPDPSKTRRKAPCPTTRIADLPIAFAK